MNPNWLEVDDCNKKNFKMDVLRFIFCSKNFIKEAVYNTIHNIYSISDGKGIYGFHISFRGPSSPFLFYSKNIFRSRKDEIA